MSKDYRVTVILDYTIEDERLDPDTFHDLLRGFLEDGLCEPAEDDDDQGFRLDTVRDINVEELSD